MNPTGKASLCAAADGGLVTGAVLIFLSMDRPASLIDVLRSAQWLTALLVLFVVVAAVGYLDARAQLLGDSSPVRSIGRGVTGGLSLAVGANILLVMPALALAVETAGYPFMIDGRGQQVLDWANVGQYLAITLVVGVALGAISALVLSWTNRRILRLLPS